MLPWWPWLDNYPGVLSFSQVTAIYLKMWYLQIPSTGARLSNELQRLDHMIGYRASNSSNGCKMTPCWPHEPCYLGPSIGLSDWRHIFHLKYDGNLFDVACQFSRLYKLLLKQFFGIHFFDCSFWTVHALIRDQNIGWSTMSMIFSLIFILPLVF